LLKKTPVPALGLSFEITLSTPLGGEKIPTVSVEAEIDGEGLALKELAETALKGQDFGQLELSGLHINLGSKKGKPTLLLINKGGCEISDSANVILSGKKIRWKAGERLTFADEYEMLRLEVMYSSEQSL
jgi:hypothetical protein